MTRITEQEDPTATDARNLEHLQRVFDGYRAAVLDDEPICPHDDSSPAALAWETGRRMAVSDLGRRD